MADRFELGHRAWPILIKWAKNKQCMTYLDLAHALGYADARPARYALWPIQDLCMEKGYPPLTSIVLNQRTNKPGSGFIAWEGDIQEAHDMVFKHPWQTLPVPFSVSHRKLLSQGTKQKKGTSTPNNFEVPDQEVRVNGRGPYQERFKRILLRAYGYACALCDTKYPGLLVASHIVPWALDQKNRLNPRNGLLLCNIHDASFDAGILSIDTNYSVAIDPISKNELGSDLHHILNVHTRKKLRLPTRGNEPDKKFLTWKLVNR
jgi:hypothetical protein